MRTENQVYASMRKLRNEYNQANMQNKVLDQKIAELEGARRYAVEAKNQAENTIDSLKRFKLDDRWKGKKYEEFNRHKDGCLSDNAGRLKRQIEDAIRQIDNEKRRLRKQQNPLVKIISSFNGTMQKLNNELNRICNTQDN